VADLVGKDEEENDVSEADVYNDVDLVRFGIVLGRP
jgi:hypothetical protein